MMNYKILFIISFTAIYTSVIAQQVFPGGTVGVGGSYNLTFPSGTCFIPNRPIGNNNTSAITKGPSYQGSFQTHQWWNYALWNVSYLSTTQNSPGVMHPHPFILEADSDGLALRYRNQNYQAATLSSNYFTADIDLKVGLYGRTTSQTQVEDYGHWHVKMVQQTGDSNNLYMTAAAGSPYVFFDLQGIAIPVITGGNMKIFATTSNSIGIISNTNSFSYPDKYFALIMPPGSKISIGGGLYVSPNSVAANTSASNIRIALPIGSNFFSVGLLPTNTIAALNLLTTYGLNFITGTDFSYAYNEATSAVSSKFTYTTIAKDGTANEGTLFALYRHQYLYSPEASTSINTGYTYLSPRGNMQLLSGNVFTTQMTYYGLLPMLSKASKADTVKLYNLCVDFAASLQITMPSTLNYDMYNTFIAISQAGRMAEVANEVGNYVSRDKCLDAAKYWIENWLSSPDGKTCHAVHYSPVFNWLTCYPDAFQADIGIHDSHFMYGYLIHGAATVARFEKRRFGNLNWVNTWKPMIDLMVRNIDDWNKNCISSANDGNNPCFPFLRYFDPYDGHSWALNYTESQESVAEAVQFAAAAALWGEVTGNIAMRDMGIMIFVNESECGRQYWYDVDNANVNKAPFASSYPYNHAGIIYTWGAEYGTFFGIQPYQIHGITYWAISGSSVWMGKNLTGLQRDYNDFLSAYGGNVSGTTSEGYWSSEMLSAMALINAPAAASLFNSAVLNNDVVFNANAGMQAYRGIGYQWISILDSVGLVDATVQANTAFFSVFYKNGCRHYMVYNAPNNPGKVVHFSDGKTFFVPADTLMVVKDCNLTALPITFLNFDIKTISNDVYIYWQTVQEKNIHYFVIEKSSGDEIFTSIDTIYSTIDDQSAVLNYSYIDRNPGAGEWYYRIRQQTYDNLYSYSSIKSVVYNNVKRYSRFKKFYYSLDDSPMIKIINQSDLKSEVEILIMDMTGKEVANIKRIFESKEQITLYNNAYSLQTGVYIIQSLNNFIQFE